MLTESQLAERKKYITGSDVSAILGVNPWKSPFDLWREKLGLVEPEDISQKPHVKAGNMLEGAVLKWFEHDTGKTVSVPGELIVSKDCPWMAGNLDGFIDAENAVLEIKTASRDDKWGDEVNNVIPVYYLTQVAHYCIVTGAEKAYVAALFWGSDFRIYEPPITQTLKDKIIERTDKFWNYHVKKEIPPEPTNFEEVKEMFPKPLPREVVADGVMENYVTAYKEVYARIKAQEKMLAGFKDRITLAIGENERLVNEDGKLLATFKQDKPKQNFNRKLFEQENPELYAKYVVESDGSRRFLAK